MVRLMATLALALVVVASPALATYRNNLVYLSPSGRHPVLGISLGKVQARTAASSPWDPAKLNFTHGVASGDPWDDSVILWTRVAPIGADNDATNVTVEGLVDLYSHDSETWVKSSSAPVCVEWAISASKTLEKGNVVDSGEAWTSSDVDWTVKVEAKKLKPFSTYYYQFTVCDSENKSPVGRTKTTPAEGVEVERPIKLAIYSCSNYPFGFFNAYGNPVRKDSVDYVVHLGDYIYEYKNGDYGWGNSFGRVPLPNKEIFSLYDYRKRIATYRTDLDLYASHQNFAWIPVWDDHEVADNTWKAGSSEMNNTEDSFLADGGVAFDQRKMNAVRAYFEWMPIRQVDMDDNLRIWRTFSFGDLFSLIMLDTRQYDRSITDVYTNTEYVHAISDDASRSLMGARQESWFYRELKTDKAKWKVVGSQIVFSRINESLALGGANPLDYDAWDGYAANRNRTLATILRNNISDVVFLAGDSHASWVSDLAWIDTVPYDALTGAGSLGVEFAGSAVSSPCPAGQNITQSLALFGSNWLIGANKELQWQELYFRGYYELEVGYDEIKASYFGLPTYATRNGYEISLANFTVKAGENKLSREGGKGIAGGVVEFGALKTGTTMQTNVTHDTNSDSWFVFGK